jgi:hypothetical protein
MKTMMAVAAFALTTATVNAEDAVHSYLDHSVGIPVLIVKLIAGLVGAAIWAVRKPGK